MADETTNFTGVFTALVTPYEVAFISQPNYWPSFTCRVWCQGDSRGDGDFGYGSK